MSPEFIGVIFALGTATAFGFGSAVARLGLVNTPVVTGTVVSMVVGAAILIIAASPSYSTEIERISLSGWGFIVFTAAINYPIGRLLLFQSMRRIGVSKGNTIVSANPAVAATVAVLWLGESLSIGLLLGMVGCVGGAIWIAIIANEGAGAGVAEDAHISQTSQGISAAIGAMFTYGLVSVLIKKIVTDVTTPLVAASLVFGIGALILSIMAVPKFRMEIKLIPRNRIWKLVIGGTSMSLGIFLFYGAASRAPITAISPIVALAPLIAIGFSQFIARQFEVADKRIWLGALAVVSGVIFISLTL